MPSPATSLKVRLIEPAPPSVNILSYGFYPRLGLPLIGAALKAAGFLASLVSTEDVILVQTNGIYYWAPAP